MALAKMLWVAVMVLVLGLAFAAEAQYVRGPRGGCYTFSASGRKRYVERSLCDPKGSARPSDSSRYHRGPRGGCYKITASGNKQYVDRSLCR